MALLQGTKALETWCRSVTEGYDNVNVLNMTTSWRSGLAFCAIIHKFRPDLIAFDQLDTEDSFGNNELAFTVAEQHLGIPALLDPQDMVECELLDRLSILTYLSQFYQTFHGATGPGKDTTPTKLRYVTGSSCSSGSSTPSKSRPGAGLMTVLPGKRSEPCKMCSKPVYILERLHVAGRLLHRTCFKCARCHHQLSIANYYETENGSYCCEMCPDEEVIQTEVAEANKKVVRSTSMEEPEEEEVEEADEVNSLPESQRPEQPVTKDEIIVEECSDKEEKMEDTVDKEEKSESLKEANENTTEAVEVTSEANEAISEANEVANEAKSESEEDEKNIIEDAEEKIYAELVVSEEVQAEIACQDPMDDKEASDDEIQKDKESCDEPHMDAPLPECDQLNDNQLDNIKDNEEHPTKASETTEPIKDEDQEESYPEDLNPFGDDETEPVATPIAKPASTNPFGSDESEEEVEELCDSAAKLNQSQPEIVVPPPKPPRLSLNPFGSDFEDEDEDEPSSRPKTSSAPRKKRQAPAPPTMTSSPIPTPRTSLQPPPRPPPPASMTSVGRKNQKDEDNLNRRSQILEEEDVINLTPMSPDKAHLDGQWKKKKGPAPPRPLPPKRQVKKLPRKAVNMELMDIEVKQQELERQGVDLEKTIREVTEKSDKERAEAGLDNNDRDSLGPEAEDLIVQLFELVNEKNELFRRQTELMYMKREHRLEEEHADIEHQIRVLMAKPDALRTDDDKKLEEKLIERLMAVVSQRNEIVDCLEMDRLRELEEDESIEIHLGEYAAIKPQDEEELLKKKKEKKKKEKKKKKKDKAYDADKDIDTSEHPSGGASLSNSPRPSPKKSPLALNDKEKAKKLKKKLLSTLKPITLKR